MHHQRVKIEEAVAGLKLAKPVTSTNGMVVLGVGSELTDGLIERLKKMGTTAVCVEADPVLMQTAAKTVEQLQQEVRHRFRNTQGDPVMQRLQDAIAQHLRASRWQESET
jgi:hypothetical protein